MATNFAAILIIASIIVFGSGCVSDQHTYPLNIDKTPIYDDIDKVQNTVELYIESYDALTDVQIQTLRENGVRYLSATDVQTIYVGLIEESNITTIKNFGFVNDVYSHAKNS